MNSKPSSPPLGESLFDVGPPPPCAPRFNLARHTLEGPGFDTGPAPDDKIALTVCGRETETWSYGRLREAVRRAAEGFRRAGVQPGDVVLLRIGNEPRFPILFFGANAAGAVPIPSSTTLTAAELAVLVEEAEPALICCADALADEARDLPARILGDSEIATLMSAPPGEYENTAAEDPAFLIFTSGTGGKPKGVLHAQRSGWGRRMMWDGWYGLRSADRVLHAGAFNWTYTLGAGLTDPWAAGASTIIYAGPRDAGVWAQLIREHDATIFAGAPGVYRQLLKSGAELGDLATLRHGITAGERTPETLREQWTAATGTALYEALGMSEISTYISSSPSAPVKPGFSGRPQAGRRVAVLDDAGQPVPIGETGRLAVSRRDPGMMLGYWRQPTPWEGEWFVTGDLAEMDAAGYVAHHGRADEVMNALGYRVSPGEVEEALSRHPDVAEAAAAALPIRADLELIAAFIVAKPGATPDAESVLAAAAERLAPYKRPREVIFVESLPRTPNGKIRRKDLIEAHRRDREE